MLNHNSDKFTRLTSMAQIGWFEVNLETQQYTLSEFVTDLLCLEKKTVGFNDLYHLVHKDYREHLKEEFKVLHSQRIFEQIFPIHTKYGMNWVQLKMESDSDIGQANIHWFGYIRCLDDIESTEKGLGNKEELNKLLYRQISISHSLLSFLQTDDISDTIREILKDILIQFNGDRTYIFEIFPEEKIQNCIYEITAENVSEEQESLQNILFDESSWWNEQISGQKAIILNTLDAMPPEARYHREILERQDIKSLMVVPLLSKKRVWGYMGIDIIKQCRNWSNADYQWFTSLANIISICIELHKSEQKAIEEQQTLQHKEEVLNNIFQNLPAGIELYDKDGYLTEINDKELEMFGIGNREDVLGVNLFSNPNIPDNIKDNLRRQEDAFFNTNYNFSAINDYYPSLKKDTINIVTKATALRDSKNNFTNYLLINVDTTEAASARSKIKEFETLFALIGDYAKVGYAVFDALSRDGYALSSWYDNIGEKDGIPLPEVIGVYRNVHPDDRAVLKEFVGNVKQGQATCLRKDIRIKRASGNYSWTSVNVLVRDFRPQDGIIEMVCVNYDITPLKQTEQKLIIARDKAEQLDRLKSAFLANMSHEIRTPLNSIVGFSTLLTETDDLEERAEYISIIQRNNELLLQLISDILDLSKIEAGTFDFVKERFEIEQACQEIVQELKAKPQKGVTLLFESHASPCHIYSDKNRFTQVLTNFINNAIKFTSQGNITVGYEITSDNAIKIYVQDTGLGVPKEKLDNIFDRFVKLNTFAQGTGIGLSICKSIITQMGGEIGVESVVNEGSCFWFTLPLQQGK
ncbi:PAS domain S-box protein [Bacteroides salyersiae CL02T12C01]|uniref:histidine kinase n=1 Tax=Bacteroides salyersiae CL02T12C01 TaxID=997887 RepID=I9SZV6_9BACE|nr:ATP-binding protein [Bacteroides salyersiae]EIY62001.1 PAS domain S-box protein [Bacteroides salyersiae CL02T12C01]